MKTKNLKILLLLIIICFVFLNMQAENKASGSLRVSIRLPIDQSASIPHTSGFVNVHNNPFDIEVDCFYKNGVSEFIISSNNDNDMKISAAIKVFNLNESKNRNISIKNININSLKSKTIRLNDMADNYKIILSLSDENNYVKNYVLYF